MTQLMTTLRETVISDSVNDKIIQDCDVTQLMTTLHKTVMRWDSIVGKTVRISIMCHR